MTPERKDFSQNHTPTSHNCIHKSIQTDFEIFSTTNKIDQTVNNSPQVPNASDDSTREIQQHYFQNTELSSDEEITPNDSEHETSQDESDDFNTIQNLEKFLTSNLDETDLTPNINETNSKSTIPHNTTNTPTIQNYKINKLNYPEQEQQDIIEQLLGIQLLSEKADILKTKIKRSKEDASTSC